MTEKKLSTLVINQVESIDVYNLLKTQGKINQDELYLISGEPDIITGVKGNKETTYRTGNINLTPADIGALPDTTEIPTVPTKVSAFDNDAGYLTQHQSLTDYPKKTELANVATSGDYTDLINTPTIPSTEGLATETYVQNKIAEVVNSAPGTLDTLNELAQALGNDPNFATTMATELGKKANTANLATVATSGSYNDLSDTPTIPSVGNGTLTIQKNGTSAGTFTANATTDKTINIIVPTKVSELTDDVVKGKYLPLTGGTMTGNLQVGSASLETNGCVTGTWLKTTANIALDSAASKIAVINDGQIYSRTAAQIKSDIGLNNVDNVKQYSASNPPPYPVTSVNGKTGAVQLTTADIDLDSSIMFLNKTNTMTANGKITMDSTYTPSANGDVATKQYVDNHVPDIDPPVGTSTNYAIYIGSTAPASGTTPLLWIDTTASTGTFKYRTSTTGTWTPVPVAYT